MVQEVEILFREDEMRFCLPSEDTGTEELLNTPAVFYLKSLREPLNLDTPLVVRLVSQIRERGGSAYDEIGVTKLWGHWIVRMKTFAPYYRSHSLQRLGRVSPEWDGNTLLQQKGLFALAHVCKYIPLSYRQMRYRARKEPRSREIYGVWRDPVSGKFVVDMEVFSKWVREIWKG